MMDGCVTLKKLHVTYLELVNEWGKYSDGGLHPGNRSNWS